jgi:hypothetical protein
VIKTMGVAGVADKREPHKAKPPEKAHVAEVKKQLHAQGAFVYETWFWHR